MTKEGSSSQVSVRAGVYGGGIRVNLLQLGEDRQKFQEKYINLARPSSLDFLEILLEIQGVQ